MKKVLWPSILLVLIAGYLLFREPGNLTEIVPDTLVSTSANLVTAAPEKISLSIFPKTIIQGDPVEIIVNGLTSTSTITSLSVNGKVIPLFLHEGKPTALVGIDLRGKTGSYSVVLTLQDGQEVEDKFVVGERIVAKAPLGIPEKLGGDTPQAEKELINTLVQEGAIINAVPTSEEKLWSGQFQFPLEGLVVITDVYGYSRLTGASTFSHKGTDFRAAVGTPVYAMNSGLVRFAQSLRNYGNTIIIDHGLGLHTIYMHLSEMDFAVGDTVEKGELIGKSGDSGYTTGPHLHISVRIGGISIDPMKFVELLGK